GEPGDAQSRGCSCSEHGGVVGLEPALRLNRDDFVAIHELPALHALHERMMIGDLLQLLGCAMCLDVIGACNELSIDRPDALRDEIGILEIAEADRAIETLGDQVDEAIAVGSMEVELRVAMRHFRQHGREMCGPERKRYGDP